MTGPTVECIQLPHRLTAVLIPRGLTAAQDWAIRQRLGIACRHGRQVRAPRGWCPACLAARQDRSTAQETAS